MKVHILSKEIESDPEGVIVWEIGTVFLRQFLRLLTLFTHIKHDDHRFFHGTFTIKKPYSRSQNVMHSTLSFN